MLHPPRQVDKHLNPGLQHPGLECVCQLGVADVASRLDSLLNRWHDARVFFEGLSSAGVLRRDLYRRRH